ncbi:unnamed protein product [Ectocarpus fasciculatus]
MKATGPPRYEYRLGFRYVSSNDSSVVERGQCRRRVASSDRIRCLRQDKSSKTSYISESLPTTSGIPLNAVRAAAAHDVTGRDLAAIQIQRLVRGWRARVWVVKVMHDRAWRALLLIQAIWRGALARHKLLRHEGPSDSPHEDENEDSSISLRNSRRQHSKGAKLTTPPPGRISEQQPNGRCPERAAWEQSWARVCLERPSFRDRVRVWQSIAELKRAGGRGRMGITNKEAWVALCQSSGSASVAATLLANEEYLLGRRLQQQDERWRLDEIPPYLSLDGGPGVSAGPLFRRTVPTSAARPFSAGVRRCDRLPVMEKDNKTGPGSISGFGVFDCVSSFFYDTPTRTAASTTTAIPAEGLSKNRQQWCLYSTR